jgi:hypothetical protein
MGVVHLCPVRVSIVLYFFYSIRLKFHCLTDAAHLYSALHAVSPAIFRSTLRQNFVVKYCRINFLSARVDRTENDVDDIYIGDSDLTKTACRKYTEKICGSRK